MSLTDNGHSRIEWGGHEMQAAAAAILLFVSAKIATFWAINGIIIQNSTWILLRSAAARRWCTLSWVLSKIIERVYNLWFYAAAERKSIQVLNTYTFIAQKVAICRKNSKIASLGPNVLSKVRFTENIEIQPEPRYREYSMNTLNIYRRRPGSCPCNLNISVRFVRKSARGRRLAITEDARTRRHLDLASSLHHPASGRGIGHREGGYPPPRQLGGPGSVVSCPARSVAEPQPQTHF